jgi:uncharacterized pyridoxal phosphate-containing UPF0001 family protein
VSDARDDLVARVSRNLEVLRGRIASTGRDQSGVTILAVTKTFPAVAVLAARSSELLDVGENYADELVAKRTTLDAPGVAWHFLGRLQRNKLGRLAPLVDVYQSVARDVEAASIARHAPGARCYVQVDVAGISGDTGRNGCALADAPGVVHAARLAGLAVEGLMCVAWGDPSATRVQFRSLRAVADDLGLPGCSMGMSGDLEIALEEGSTMVRVGTALFGERLERPDPAVA